MNISIDIGISNKRTTNKEANNNKNNINTKTNTNKPDKVGGFNNIDT